MGAGLIGTSMGLALAGSRDVLLSDSSPEHVRVAAERGAGRPWDGEERSGVVVVATPPSVVGRVLRQLQQMDAAQTYMHVASVQSRVEADIEALGCEMASVVGTHPLAGREVGGPASGTAGLFRGRQWAVCPSPSSAPDHVATVLDIVRACGATPVLTDPEQHDAAVALTSHLPHLASALLAGLVGQAPDAALRLAGPGLADATRLAAGDPALWQEILGLNAHHVAPLARRLGQALSDAAADLDMLGDRPDGTGLARRLEQGQAGRARVPVKRELHDEGLSQVAVLLPDEPGQLARLLASAAAGGVNVEDVRVEHTAGQPTGTVALWVLRAAEPVLRGVLQQADWTVLGA